MGLLDGLKSVLGVKAEADATRDADPDDLFGMSTAYITMEADLGYEPTGEAALCFADVDSTDFQDAMDEVESILDAGRVETGTRATFETDDHGYQWVVLHDDDFEDLLTSIHFAADTLVERRYGSRLLAALFAFEDARSDQVVYWVYSFRRGAYYPFAPAPHDDHERNTSAEFKLDSNLGDELTVESDKEYWYPLWPDRPGYHPWE
ncbi:PspA-associated protein PspAB [Haloarcula salina]|uniref:PspA-associated protein PspAB n=1 Tax=Haloarcula salina TaxID=1429914 RepID=UPI003C6F0FDD